MSYFGQKKKQKRINVFLAASLSLVAILLFLALLIPETAFSVWVDGCRFQIYLFTIVVMIYALFCRKTMFAVMALCLLLFNYTIISSSTNLFFNVLVKGEETMHLQYHQGKTGFPDIVSAIGAPTKRMGTVRLAPGREVIFVTFRTHRRRFTVFNADFNGLLPSEVATLYNNLAEFVLSQDEPLILVGDFGIPAWAPAFKTFLHRTSLEVKNRILPTDGKHIFNPFAVPSINLLAYKNVGIKNISFYSRDEAAGLPLQIDFELEYN